MAKNSFWVTVIFGLSTLLQLVSQIVITRLFGATLPLEIFLAAVTLPTIIVTIIYGTLNNVLLPMYGKDQKINGKTADARLLGNILQTLGLGSILMVLLILGSPILAHVLFASRGIAFVQQTTLQMQILLSSIPFSIVATGFGSYFYTHKKFLVFPLAQGIGSIVNLLFIIVLYQFIGIWSLVAAFVLNILIQIFFVLPSKILILKPKFSNWKILFFAWLPLIVGAFALRSDVLLVRSFGANLPTGYLVYLNLIYKFFSLATGIMTIGIQITLLPHLVDFVHEKNYKDLDALIRRTKLLGTIISIAVALAMWLAVPVLLQLLFLGGKFQNIDIQKTITLIPYFVLPAIGWGINSFFSQPLVAIQKTRAVGMINVISLILSWITAKLLLLYFGPLIAICGGLIVLLFSGIILNEITWKKYRKQLHQN